jgi:sugar lactone lactonase YvrE
MYRVFVRLISLTCASFFIAMLSGCPSSGSSGNNTVINGVVSTGGGSTPIAISGATVTIYQIQSGTPSVVTQTTSDSAGNFSVKVPSNSANTTSNPVTYYALASKSPSIQLMASLGTGPLSAVRINELTTVASAYVFAQLFRDDYSVAGSALPLSIAAGMAENLVSAESGSASTVIQTSPNGYETNTWSALGTLANVLAGCTQGIANACTNLFALTPTASGVTPTTTLQAIVNIALNPAVNVSGIYNLGSVVTSYSPALNASQGPNSSAPLQKLDAWTMAVKVNNTGSSSCPFGGPANVAFDTNGYAWINNNVIQGTPNSTNCLVVLKPNGQPANGIANGSTSTPTSPITGGGILGSGFGIAIDKLGYIWSGSFGWGNNLPASGAVAKLSSLGVPISPAAGYTSGLLRVQGTAVDQSNNIWMASYGNNAVVVYPNQTTNPVSYVDSNTEPFGMAITTEGYAWVTYTGSDTVSKLRFSNGGISKLFTVTLPGGSNPKGIAVDSLGNAWVAAGSTSTVYAINSSGTIVGTYTGQGINGPWGVSLDANGNVWVANFGTSSPSARYSIVQLCGATSNCPAGITMGTAITPSTGYTLPSAGSQVLLNSGQPLYGAGAPPSYLPLMRLTSVNADMAGNIWAANNWKPSGLNDILLNPGGDGMVIFVGVAAPTKAPSLGPAQAP